MCLFFLGWGPFVHFLGIVQWNSTRQDHPGSLGGVSGSGLVNPFIQNTRTSTSGQHITNIGFSRNA